MTVDVPADRDFIGLSSIFLHDKDCTDELEMDCEVVQLEKLSFLYNRCPRNTIEVASYLMDKYADTKISYNDFIISPEPATAAVDADEDIVVS